MKKEGIYGTGEVMKIWTTSKGRTGTVHYAILEYFVNNMRYEKRFDNALGVEVGEVYQIIYRETNPEYVDAFFNIKIESLEDTLKIQKLNEK